MDKKQTDRQMDKRQTDRWTKDRQMDKRQTDSWTKDRHTDGQTDRWTKERQTDKQTDRHHHSSAIWCFNSRVSIHLFTNKTTLFGNDLYLSFYQGCLIY